MSGFRDPAIKLFGKTISLQSNQKAASASATVTDATSTTSKATSASVSVHKQHPSSHDDTITSNKGLNEQVHDQYEKKPSGGELAKHEICSTHQGSEDLKHPTTSSAMCENQKSPSVNKETASPESPGDGEQSDTTSSSQEKTLKKPDKIIPCPRCNSMDTKFCYYNNYNVNQPRHFCKNCQRYWTAGGTMRNVPVGAGRRKNKHSSASHYGNILVSEALQSARANAASGLHHPTLSNNGTVLNFGSDAPLCESMVSVLKIAEKNQTCFPNRFQEGRDIGDDQSSNSNTAALNSTENGLKNSGSQEQLTKNFQGFPLQVPYFPGTPWPPAFCPPGFPVSFYQPPNYWGCTLPGSWTVPWLSPPPNSPNHSFVSSSPSSPTLGKHSRDGNILNSSCNSEKEELSKENNSERGVWIPKTLRIDGPSEAAKSSIWATLGIKDEKTSSKNGGGGLFKSFQTKGVQEEDRIGDTLSVLQANPAAMSRALSFHETT